MACKETSIYFHGFVQVLLDVEVFRGSLRILYIRYLQAVSLSNVKLR